ncbi:MAG: ferrous iron transport protein A [Gammaproteobacteria bacterium]|jgi:Fe2+ transport system protein FeoA|nr:ferrous iron transport protein A [Gammaproteobacteria bacterium]
MTLIELSRGETAVITQIRSPDLKMREKLHARGLAPGAEIALMQAGKLIVVGLEHSRWALNRSEALHIEVSPLNVRLKKRRSWIHPFCRP